MFFESRHIQYIRFTWSSIFFCLKPGNPSYQMEASSCWTFGCATNWKEIHFNLCIWYLQAIASGVRHKLSRNIYGDKYFRSLYFYCILKNFKKKTFKKLPFSVCTWLPFSIFSGAYARRVCTPDPEFDNIFIRCTDLSLLFVFVLNGKLMIGVVDVHCTVFQ